MFGIPNFDLTTDQGKQSFINYIVNLIRKEIISYSPSYSTVAAGIGDYVYQNTPYLDFDTDNPGEVGIGQLAWNDTAGTLEFGLKGGNVTMPIGTRSVAMVKHADNSGLAKGKVVYVVGSDGINKTVRYALATSDATSARTFGVVSETVSGGAKAFITTQGLLEDINTIGLTEGAAIWVSPTTAGELTTTKPVAPNHLVLVGWCIRSHATTGVIFVHVVNGFELDELHDVKITSPADQEVIRYDAAQSLWVNGEAGGSIEVSDSAPAGPSIGDLWYNSSNGRTYIRYDSFWVEIGNTGDATSSHASTHITGAADVIDGDRLNISYVPTSYTRNSSALGASTVEDLTAHLSGINTSLAPSFVTSLPVSPYDGQIIYYRANATDGVIWQLRYNSSSASAYKWEFIGGGSLFATVGSDTYGVWETYSSLTFGDLATVGPSIVAPLAGEYMCRFAVTSQNGSTSSNVKVWVTGDTLPTWQISDSQSFGNITQVNATHNAIRKRTVPTAGNTIKLIYAVSNAGVVCNFWHRRLEVFPIRVG